MLPIGSTRSALALEIMIWLFLMVYVCQRTEARKINSYSVISTISNQAGGEKAEVSMQNPTKGTKPDDKKKLAPEHEPQKKQAQQDDRQNQKK